MFFVYGQILPQEYSIEKDWLSQDVIVSKGPLNEKFIDGLNKLNPNQSYRLRIGDYARILINAEQLW